jgi:hypothetical protein
MGITQICTGFNLVPFNFNLHKLDQSKFELSCIENFCQIEAGGVEFSVSEPVQESL